MTASVEQIVGVASVAVGPCGVVSDLSWSHGESIVVELEAVNGERFVGKAHRKPASFAAEYRAYHEWAPALAGRAPTLVACDPELQVIVMTKLTGSALEGDDVASPAVHHQAGALLARFHQSGEPVRLVGFARSQRERFNTWVDRAEDGLFDDADVAFVDEQLAILEAMPDPLGVPCHRDWQPRNWVIDDAGSIRAFDFEHSRPAPWHEDLYRLWWNEWAEAPELAQAFFAGYGRVLTDDEVRAFRAQSSLGHLVQMVWAHEHDDDAFGAHARRCLANAKNTRA